MMSNKQGMLPISLQDKGKAMSPAPMAVPDTMKIALINLNIKILLFGKVINLEK
jgi:hypothetical protein